MEGGLEVDGRNSLPVPCQKQSEGYKYYNGEEQCDRHPCNRCSSDPRPQSRQVCGLRPVTLFLSIALAVSVVLAAIAAGVAGSRAAKRGDARYYCLPYHRYEARTDISTCRTTSQPQPCSSSQAFNASSPSSNDTSVLPTYHNDSPSSNDTSVLPTYHNDINDSPFQPTSNCTSFSSNYNSRFTSASFKLQCGLDLHGHDMYSVFVYYFTDCIEACAVVSKWPNLNLTCYGVTFDINFDLTRAGQYGNCFLKSSSTFGLTEANINFTSSAVLVMD